MSAHDASQHPAAGQSGGGDNERKSVMAPRQRYGRTRIDVGNTELTPEQIVRLTRLGRELRLVDQILSTDVDKVEVVAQGPPAAAWTSIDGDKISFHAQRMPDPVDRYDLAVWLGTNAHELGHVLYSPRSDSLLMRRMAAGEGTFLSGISQIHNIVEDQRQERLLLARFSPWSGYLVAALGHHLKVDSKNAWFLLCGRTWIDAEVRAKARATFVAHRSEPVADEVARLVGEYQRLFDPGDTEAAEAWDVMEKLHAIFEGEIPDGGGCTVIVVGEPDTDGEDGEAWPTADEADDWDDAEDAEDGDEGEAKTEGTRDRKPDDSRSDKPQDSDDERATADKGKGAGLEKGKPKSEQDVIRESLRKAAKSQILDDDDATDELDSILDAIEHGRGSDEIEGDVARGVYRPVTDAARRLHREISEALVDFKDATEPGWAKRTDSGRLAVRRLVNPNVSADEMFDRYEPGQMDATALEVCLLLDVSGSMSGEEDKLAEATWAIRQAVDDVEGTITVFTYESSTQVLAQPHERVDDRMFIPATYGGTNPLGALSDSWQILSGSEARNRLMIVMTDGAWGYTSEPKQLIEAMRSIGVATVFAYLPPQYHYGPAVDDENVDKHGCQFGGVIATLDELPRLFQHVALQQMKRQWL